MTETLERDLTTQEHLENAHDAEFVETMEHLNYRESAQEAIPQTISYKIKSGDTLISITKNEILKYYPQLDENDKKKLTNPNTSPVIALLRTYNGGSDNLQAGKTLTIDMGPITQAIQNDLNNKNGGNNGHESAQEAIPQTISYKIKSGDTLISITKNEILKYYPQLDENDKKKLTNPNTSPVIALLRTYNGGSDNLQAGKTLTIDMGPITQAIQNDLNNKNGGNIETENGKKDVVTLTSYEEFKKCKDPFVHRLYKDGGEPENYIKKKPGGRIAEKLKNGKKVKIPTYMEKENAKRIEGGINAITKPDENFVKELKAKHLDKKLDKKTFVIDPGHGFNDIGAMGIVNDGQDEDVMVTVFESSIVMDISYRVAKLLRSYGANVVFTHYIPTRGISDKTNLPPCVQTEDSRGYNYAHHQDKWENRNESYPPNGKAAKKLGYNSISNRKAISNKYKNSAMFVSFHTNSNDSFSTYKQTDVYYKENSKESKDFSDYLMGPKGIGEFKLDSGGKRQNKYTQGSHQRTDRMRVISNQEKYENKNPGVLIEMFNVNNTEQANQYRNPSVRQQKAEQLVDAIINYNKR